MEKEQIILVTGGARSGKSAFAETRLAECAGKKAYIATAQALDGEMEERIAAHRRRRPACWQTFEVPYGLPGRMAEILKEADAVLLDCLTLYVSNYVLAHEEEEEQAVAAGIIKEIEAVVDAVQAHKDKTLIMVTNEVGWGIVPMNSLSRLYRDVAGKVNQYAASRADAVYCAICGIPVNIKALAAQGGRPL